MMPLTRHQPDQDSGLENIIVVAERQIAGALEDEIEFKVGMPVVDMVPCARSSSPHFTHQPWDSP